jgi:hypothetical protein
MLDQEDKELESYVMMIQDNVFDYFNLIVKEYKMAIDKWS